MPLPPRGDPRRPLHLAVRLMRMLGGMLLLFSTVIVVTFVLRAGRGRVAIMFVAWRAIIVLLFYLLPGAGFLILSVYVSRKQRWAVVASICLSALVALVGLFGLLLMLYFTLQPGASPFMLIPMGISLLVVLALGQLVYHLSLSFEAIRHMPPDERGFEPVMVTPLPAAEMYTDHDRRHEP